MMRRASPFACGAPLLLLLAIAAASAYAAPVEFIGALARSLRSLNAEGFSQHAMDATNNFTLMTWTPQGNALTPVATLTFAQIGTWP